MKNLLLERDNMLRTILIIIAAIILYRILRSSSKPKGGIKSRHSSTYLEDEMVKDPYCQTYFLKRMAYKAEINGDTMYFCSKKCLEEYHQSHRGEEGEGK